MQQIKHFVQSSALKPMKKDYVRGCRRKKARSLFIVQARSLFKFCSLFFENLPGYLPHPRCFTLLLKHQQDDFLYEHLKSYIVLNSLLKLFQQLKARNVDIVIFFARDRK